METRNEKRVLERDTIVQLQNLGRLAMLRVKIGKVLFVCICLLLFSTVFPYSQPIGVFPINLNGESDNYISLPLQRPTVFQGRVSIVNENTFFPDVEEPPWVLNQFSDNEGFYVKICDGIYKGRTFSVNGNDTNSVNILTDRVLDFSDLVGGIFKIIPYWTPITIFEHSDVPNRTQIILRDGLSNNINNVPNTILTYYENNGWYTQTFENADHYPILKNTGLQIRTPLGSNDFVLNLVGMVPIVIEKGEFVNFPNNFGTDIWFGFTVPEDITLQNSLLSFKNRVMIFVYKNSFGYNPTPSDVYTFFEGYGWFNSRFVDSSGVILEPNESFVIRFPKTNEKQYFVWERFPIYMNEF